MAAEMKEKNIYHKLQESRVLLQNRGLKKSGNNKFSNYTYWELDDFLGATNEIFRQIGLFSHVTFSEGLAVLTVHDCDGDGSIEFSIPHAKAELKGCHPIQNLGAEVSYCRRYLMMMAMEIAEHDAVDVMPKQDQKPEPKPDYAAILTASKNLQELGLAWQTVPHNIKLELTALKDGLKEKLTPKADETDWKSLIADTEDMDALTAIYRSMSPAQQGQYNVDIDFRSSELQDKL
jgi:ERF superfamily